ncbi:MAG: FecR family protein [Legionella sp.]|uniref:FecR family protein n=1 Tax=Legionella sp. TaxID=459 RepID=UPI0039E3DC87
MKTIIWIGFLLATNQVFAEAAKVLYTQNKVTLIHNDSVRILSRGATVDAGDQIHTGDGGVAHIQYTNGTLVNIGSNSSYKILTYSPKSDIQINAEVHHGKVEIENLGKIKETLKTPIVSLAILGTHINVYVPSAKMTYIRVIKGLVLVRNEYLRPGDSVRVTADSIKNAPFPKDGLVISPVNAPGKIEDITAGVTLDLGAGGLIGAQIVTYVSTNQNIGMGTTVSMEALTSATATAEISLICDGTF